MIPATRAADDDAVSSLGLRAGANVPPRAGAEEP